MCLLRYNCLFNWSTHVQFLPPELQAFEGSRQSCLVLSLRWRSIHGCCTTSSARCQGKTPFAFRAGWWRLADEEKLTHQVNEECSDNQYFGAISNDVPSSSTGPSDNWVGQERQMGTHRGESCKMASQPRLPGESVNGKGAVTWRAGGGEGGWGESFLKGTGKEGKSKKELGIAAATCPQAEENWSSAHDLFMLTFNLHCKIFPSYRNRKKDTLTIWDPSPGLSNLNSFPGLLLIFFKKPSYQDERPNLLFPSLLPQK